MVGGPGEELTATAQTSVFDASPITEAAVPAPKQGNAEAEQFDISLDRMSDSALREEAADLRARLTEASVFRIHAQHLFYRRAILKVELRLSIADAASQVALLFTAAVVCAIPLAPQGWRTLLVRAGIAGSVLLVGSVWSGFRSLRSLMHPGHPLRETPPPEIRALTQRLTRFLDGADGSAASPSLPVAPEADLNLAFATSSIAWLNTGHEPVDGFYKSLPAGRRKVRLLILRPGNFDAELNCSLYVSDVAYPYDALSYVWGDETSARETVTLDGKPFVIRHNLAVALRHLRRQKVDRMLWVDAVCINQNDIDERNRQVAMMSEIYEHADSVVVFLGADDERPCSELFDFLHALRAAEEYHADSVLEKTDIPAVLDQLQPLLQKPWWSRVWVVQEFACARRDPVLVFGHRQTDARTFWRGLDLLRERLMANLYPRDGWLSNRQGERPSESGLHLVGGVDSVAEDWHMLQMRYSFASWRNRFHPAMYSIFDLLTITRAHRATDPRDHVFALNSLMMEPFQTALAPDYNKTMAAAYTRTAACLLCIQSWSEIYNLFPVGLNPELPSWVPDFSQGLRLDMHSDHDRLWRLAPRITTIGQMDCCVSAGVLAAHGVDCGEVTSVEDFDEDEEGFLLRQPRGPGFPRRYMSLAKASHVLGRSDFEMIASSARSKNNKTDNVDFGEKLYRLFAACGWDPNQPPFITREDVAEMVKTLSPQQKSNIFVMLNRKSLGFLGQSRSFGDWDQDIMSELERMVKLIRENRRLQHLVKDKDRAARLRQKTERGRWKLDQIEEDLRTDALESAKGITQVRQAAAEFEQRANALGDGERDSATTALVTAAARIKYAMVCTAFGMVGVAPPSARQGDRLVMLHGMPSLFVARACGDDGHQLVFVGRVIVLEDPVERIRKGIEDGVLAEKMMRFR